MLDGDEALQERMHKFRSDDINNLCDCPICGTSRPQFAVKSPSQLILLFNAFVLIFLAILFTFEDACIFRRL